MVLLFSLLCLQFPADPAGEKASLPPPGGAVGCGEDGTSALSPKEGSGEIQSPQSTTASSSKSLYQSSLFFALRFGTAVNKYVVFSVCRQPSSDCRGGELSGPGERGCHFSLILGDGEQFGR